jgi:hypothetical protein
VAMANKSARILCAVMTREQGFDPSHVSVKPRCEAAGERSSGADAAARGGLPGLSARQHRSDRLAGRRNLPPKTCNRRCIDR